MAAQSWKWLALSEISFVNSISISGYISKVAKHIYTVMLSITNAAAAAAAVAAAVVHTRNVCFHTDKGVCVSMCEYICKCTKRNVIPIIWFHMLRLKWIWDKKVCRGKNLRSFAAAEWKSTEWARVWVGWRAFLSKFLSYIHMELFDRPSTYISPAKWR